MKSNVDDEVSVFVTRHASASLKQNSERLLIFLVGLKFLNGIICLVDFSCNKMGIFF